MSFVNMKKKLKLEIEKGIDEKTSSVGISKEVTITDGRGSNLKGSISLIPGCDSYQTLEKEVAAIREEFDALLEESKRLFGGQGKIQETLDIDESKSAREIWDFLSTITATEVFSATFNGMSYEKRIEVADYVLSHCNVFSGQASVFSMRYNSEEGLLD
jgi:hypothetical protein